MSHTGERLFYLGRDEYEDHYWEPSKHGNILISGDSELRTKFSYHLQRRLAEATPFYEDCAYYTPAELIEYLRLLSHAVEKGKYMGFLYLGECDFNDPQFVSAYTEYHAEFGGAFDRVHLVIESPSGDSVLPYGMRVDVQAIDPTVPSDIMPNTDVTVSTHRGSDKLMFFSY